MPFDLKQWLSKLAATGELSAEDTALLEGKLAKPKLVELIQQDHEGGLRQSDYDRKMNELKTNHQKEMDRLKNLETGMNTWREEAQRKLDEATTKYNSAITTKAQYEATLRQVATDYGLDVNTLIPNATSTPPPPPAPVRTDPANPPANPDALKNLQADLDKARQVFPFLPAELHDLSVEHQQLFKAPLANSSAIVKKAIEEGKPIRTVWEEDYKVGERRNQVAAETQAAHDKQVADDAVKAYISSHSVPDFQPASGPRSPVLAAFPAKNLGQAKTGEMSSLDRAVAEFETRQHERGNSAA